MLAAWREVNTRTMSTPSSTTLEAELRAALDWWREAGVDHSYGEEPTGWLAEPEEIAAASPAPAAREEAPPPPPPKIGGDRASWPSDLATFHNWWLSEDTLDHGGTYPRISPRGEARPSLMVLVPEPEADDHERLLSGPQGRLLDAMLRAMGAPPERVYLASALPRHTPLPDWDRIAAEGMGAVLSHHVQLVAPRRLLVLGRNILPLFGHDAAQGSAASFLFNHEGGNVPAMAGFGLETLLARASERARFWRRWLEWTDGNSWLEASERGSPQD